MAKGAMTNIESLKAWFLAQKTGKWNLYRGHLSKAVVSNLICKLDADIEVGEAFDQLEEMIRINSESGSGQFTIYVPTVNHNTGTRVWFDVVAAQNNAVAGINGIGSMAQLGVIEAEVNKRIERERENWELKRDVEDLQAAMEAKVSPFERVMDSLLSNEQVVAGVTGLLMQAGARFLSKGQPVQLSGFDQNTPPVPPQGTPPNSEGITVEYDSERLLALLNPIRAEFNTTEEMFVFLFQIQKMFLNDPNGVKQLIASFTPKS